METALVTLVVFFLGCLFTPLIAYATLLVENKMLIKVERDIKKGMNWEPKPLIHEDPPTS